MAQDERPANAVGVTSMTVVPGRTGTLGRAFDATAASYKFFWFLALLRLLPHAVDGTLAIRRLVTEMVIVAWAPAALYRLSFGAHDRLQDMVRDLQAAKRLRPTSSETRVRAALASWVEGHERLEGLSALVPTRFLGPWLELDLSPAIRDDRRTRAIVRTAREQLLQSDGPPYAIDRGADGSILVFGPGWQSWLLQHQRLLEGHAEFALTRFLQARNPHVPGITDKVRMPGLRKLAPARRLFERLRAHTGILADVYDGQPLGSSYAIDHILPRSFVAHDLIWNLAPTSTAHNTAKGEQLPDVAMVAQLGAFHHSVIAAAPTGCREFDDYLAVFGVDESELCALSQDRFVERYVAILAPLIQIAGGQGFRIGWQAPRDGGR